MREESGVTCSCGVAPNRMLAKVRWPRRPHCRHCLRSVSGLMCQGGLCLRSMIFLEYAV